MGIDTRPVDNRVDKRSELRRCHLPALLLVQEAPRPRQPAVVRRSTGLALLWSVGAPRYTGSMKCFMIARNDAGRKQVGHGRT